MKLAGPFALDTERFAHLSRRATDLAPRLEAIDADTGVRARRSRAQEEEPYTAIFRDVDVDWMGAEDRPIRPVLVVFRELRLHIGDDPLPVADLQGLAFELGCHFAR